MAAAYLKGLKPAPVEVVAGCFGKDRFETHDRAMQVVNKGNRAHDVRLNVYKCKNCKYFHIGTPSRFKTK